MCSSSKLLYLGIILVVSLVHGVGGLPRTVLGTDCTLHCIAQHCTTLHCTVLHFTAQYLTLLYLSALCRIALDYTALHCSGWLLKGCGYCK